MRYGQALCCKCKKHEWCHEIDGKWICDRCEEKEKERAFKSLTRKLEKKTQELKTAKKRIKDLEEYVLPGGCKPLDGKCEGCGMWDYCKKYR